MTPSREVDLSGERARLAFEKTARVLGPDRARSLLESLLAELRLDLATPQDLLRLSERMSMLGGFEGAVGAMLGVTAVLRGASPSAGASGGAR